MRSELQRVLGKEDCCKGMKTKVPGYMEADAFEATKTVQCKRSAKLAAHY